MSASLPAEVAWDAAGVLLAMFLTVCLLSYLYRDNPFYKWAEHMFIGMALGYLIVVPIFNVLYPRFFSPLLIGESRAAPLAVYVIASLLALLFAARYVPGWSFLARLPAAWILGVFIGLAMQTLGRGVLLPQLVSTMEGPHRALNADAQAICLHTAQSAWQRLTCSYGGIVELMLMLLAVLSVVTFFVRTATPARALQPVRRIGGVFLMMGLGSALGLALSGQFMVASQRLYELWHSPWASVPALLAVGLGLMTWRRSAPHA